MMIVIFFLLIALVQIAESARILCVIPTPSYSHQVVFQPLWKELSLRGHQVTVLTTNPINDPTLTNLTEIDLSFSYKFLENNLLEIINSSKNIFKVLDLTVSSFIDVNDQQLQHPQVQKLINDPNEHFDLVISEFILAPPFYFSRRFQCPYIGVLSVDPNNLLYTEIGAFTHTILYPDFTSEIYGKPNLLQRVYLVLLDNFIYFYLKKVANLEQKVVWKHFHDNTPIRTIRQNVSLVFVNADPIFHYVRPSIPSVIQIGGTITRTPSNTLQKEIKEFLDQAQKGFIYFSLGSNVKSKDIPPHTMNVILQTFQELPYQILWKYELSDLPNKPDNVFITKWVSQQDVLHHPNLKLFITHGGAQSMEEAIFARVPIVGMPFFVDQPFNVKKMVSLGFALSVDYREMSVKEFKDTILEVINNPKYRSRITELADLAADQPLTGLEKAVWWTEYVIRHKGAAHLKSPLLDVLWYQYYLLDVMAVILSTVLVLIYLFILSIKLFIKFLKFITQKRSKVKKQ